MAPPHHPGPMARFRSRWWRRAATRKAAEKLHKSQSSVTYAVQQLESQLGVKAFQIEGRKAVPDADRRAAVPARPLPARRGRGPGAVVETAVRGMGSARSASPSRSSSRPGCCCDCLDTPRHGKPAHAHRGDRNGARPPHRCALVRAGGPRHLRQRSAGIPGRCAACACASCSWHSPHHPLHGSGASSRCAICARTAISSCASRARSAPAPTSMEATQRWTVSHIGHLVEAARAGYGFVWLPEERIRDELAAGTLKPLPLREGGERFAELYLDLRRSRARRPRHAAPRRDHPGGGGERVQAPREESKKWWKLGNAIFDQAAERLEGLRLVGAAGLDRYRAADARGEEHDGEDVPRVCRAPVESERDATPEP